MYMWYGRIIHLETMISYLKDRPNNGNGFKSVNLKNSNGTSVFPQIALDGNNVYVVWQDNTTGNDDIFLQRSLSNGTKFGDRNISNNNGTSEKPQISIPNGEIYVAWRDNDRGIYDIFFRHGKKDSGTGRSEFGPSYNLNNNESAHAKINYWIRIAVRGLDFLLG